MYIVFTNLPPYVVKKKVHDFCQGLFIKMTNDCLVLIGLCVGVLVFYIVLTGQANLFLYLPIPPSYTKQFDYGFASLLYPIPKLINNMIKSNLS